MLYPQGQKGIKENLFLFYLFAPLHNLILSSYHVTTTFLSCHFSVGKNVVKFFPAISSVGFSGKFLQLYLQNIHFRSEDLGAIFGLTLEWKLSLSAYGDVIAFPSYRFCLQV